MATDDLENRRMSDSKKWRYQIANGRCSSGAWRKCGLSSQVYCPKIAMSQRQHILLEMTIRQYLKTHKGISRRFIAKHAFLIAFLRIVDHESAHHLFDM